MDTGDLPLPISNSLRAVRYVFVVGVDDDFDKFWGSLHKELDFVGFGIRRVHVKVVSTLVSLLNSSVDRVCESESPAIAWNAG